MKYLILSLFIFSLYECGNARKNEIIQERLTMEIDETKKDSLFLIESLQDTLHAYMEYIDTIPDPSGLPIVYTVIFDKHNSDTIVSYLSSVSIIEIISNTPLLKGATQIKGENVVILSSNISSLSNIVCEKKMSLDYYHYLDSIIYGSSEFDFRIIYMGPEWIYKYNNGELILIEKKDKNMDKIREKLKL